MVDHTLPDLPYDHGGGGELDTAGPSSDVARARDGGRARRRPRRRHPQGQQVLARFAEEVIPLVRREVTTTLWGPDDPRRASGLA